MVSGGRFQRVLSVVLPTVVGKTGRSVVCSNVECPCFHIRHNPDYVEAVGLVCS